MHTKLDLKCYCCGETLGNLIALVRSGDKEGDRVFVVDVEHVGRLDDANWELVIRGTPRTRS